MLAGGQLDWEKVLSAVSFSWLPDENMVLGWQQLSWQKSNQQPTVFQFSVQLSISFKPNPPPLLRSFPLHARVADRHSRVHQTNRLFSVFFFPPSSGCWLLIYFHLCLAWLDVAMTLGVWWCLRVMLPHLDRTSKPLQWVMTSGTSDLRRTSQIGKSVINIYVHLFRNEEMRKREQFAIFHRVLQRETWPRVWHCVWLERQCVSLPLCWADNVDIDFESSFFSLPFWYYS